MALLGHLLRVQINVRSVVDYGSKVLVALSTESITPVLREAEGWCRKSLHVPRLTDIKL